jgi:hypothetical protein
MVAAAIVEHIRLCNWRVERGPPWDSTGKCFSPAADHECRSASPAVPAIGIRTARSLAAILHPLHRIADCDHRFARTHPLWT